MTDHDPLCPVAEQFPDSEILQAVNCICALITFVRANEREITAAQIALAIETEHNAARFNHICTHGSDAAIARRFKETNNDWSGT
jgi:hypothetical protein